jgi:hypothetical protein
MRAMNLVLLAAFVFLSSTLTSAQNGFLSDWFNMVSETQAAQPHWITPLATTTPRLEQEFRYDIQWQSLPVMSEVTADRALSRATVGDDLDLYLMGAQSLPVASLTGCPAPQESDRTFFCYCRPGFQSKLTHHPPRPKSARRKLCWTLSRKLASCPQ